MVIWSNGVHHTQRLLAPEANGLPALRDLRNKAMQDYQDLYPSFLPENFSSFLLSLPAIQQLFRTASSQSQKVTVPLARTFADCTPPFILKCFQEAGAKERLAFKLHGSVTDQNSMEGIHKVYDPMVDTK